MEGSGAFGRGRGRPSIGEGLCAGKRGLRAAGGLLELAKRMDVKRCQPLEAGGIAVEDFDVRVVFSENLLIVSSPWQIQASPTLEDQH